MMLGGFVAVGVGAALGAWLRWGLSTWLNPRVPSFPLGTLAANLAAGTLLGFAHLAGSLILTVAGFATYRALMA